MFINSMSDKTYNIVSTVLLTFFVICDLTGIILGALNPNHCIFKEVSISTDLIITGSLGAFIHLSFLSPYLQEISFIYRLLQKRIPCTSKPIGQYVTTTLIALNIFAITFLLFAACQLSLHLSIDNCLSNGSGYSIFILIYVIEIFIQYTFVICYAIFEKCNRCQPKEVDGGVASVNLERMV